MRQPGVSGLGRFRNFCAELKQVVRYVLLVSTVSRKVENGQEDGRVIGSADDLLSGLWRPGRRGVAQLVVASVSKTEGRRFDPCLPCQKFVSLSQDRLINFGRRKQ